MNGIATIEASVSRLGPDGAWGDLEVRVGSELVLREIDFPLSQLANGLRSWAASVTDHAPSTYVLRVADRPDLFGAFRIEPRPVGWQFTSVRELARHVPIPLEAWLRSIDAFEHKLVSDVPAPYKAHAADTSKCR
jgi:hypothetical protein